MKRTVLPFLVLVSVCATAATAQSVDKIISQFRKAIGGDAAKSIRTTTMVGSIRHGDGPAGRFMYRASTPDRLRLDIETAGKKLSEAYNGKSAWRLDQTGLRTLIGDETKRMQLWALLANDRLLTLKQNYITPQPGLASKIDGRDVVAVEFVKEMARMKLFFDSKSGLIVKQERGAAGVAEETFYDDYRAVDGVMEPFSIRIRGSEEITVKIETVEHNKEIDEAVFRPPATEGSSPLPDVESLIKSLIENQERVERLTDQYTYRKTETTHSLNKDGSIKSSETKVYEVIPVGSDSVRKLISVNGKDLSAEDREKEERQVQKDVERILKEREQRSDKGVSSAQQAEEKDDLAISRILRVCEISSLRREVFGGRSVIAFDYQPRKEFKSSNKAESIVNKLAGTAWIDESARQVIRLEARFTESFKFGGGLLGSVSPSSSYAFEQELVNNEVWLPSAAEVNLGGRVLFSKLNRKILTRYSDYKRYSVDSQYKPSKPSEAKKPDGV